MADTPELDKSLESLAQTNELGKGDIAMIGTALIEAAIEDGLITDGRAEPLLDFFRQNGG